MLKPAAAVPQPRRSAAEALAGLMLGVRVSQTGSAHGEEHVEAGLGFSLADRPGGTVGHDITKRACEK
jgi:hypothetical protein